MSRAAVGDTVKVHYTGMLEDGSVFDSSVDRDPLEFTIGAGQVIPGFEAAVTGMEVGETKETRLEPEDAYGPHREEMVVTVERSRLPDGLVPHVGQRLSVEQSNGARLIVRVADVSEDSVTVDANHQLAGQPLRFDLRLVDLQHPASE